MLSFLGYRKVWRIKNKDLWTHHAIFFWGGVVFALNKNHHHHAASEINLFILFNKYTTCQTLS